MRVRDLIHATDPYQGLTLGDYSPDLHGWGSEHPIFGALLADLRPRRILEVGTWKGASALHMADLAVRLGLTDCEICCVDTWLGALEFWTDHGDPLRYGSLNLVNGYPSVYYTFLKNVAAHHATQAVTPFPVTSAIAARFFAHHKIAFDLIYIDASHDTPDVLADLQAFWPLLSPEGILFGDDYNWPSAASAVDDFAGRQALRAESYDEKWLLRRVLRETWLRNDEVGIDRTEHGFAAFSRADYGYGFAGWTVASDSVMDLRFTRLDVPRVPYARDDNAFFGVMIDYSVAGGGFVRVALCSPDILPERRTTLTPHWGKGALPDHFLPLAIGTDNTIDLLRYRPENCVGSAIVSFGIQNVGPGFSAVGTLIETRTGAARAVDPSAIVTLRRPRATALSRRPRLL